MLDGLFDHEKSGLKQWDAPDGVVVGIDLGTTNSVIAAIVDAKVRIITDDKKHHLHPSVVAFKPNNQIDVGVPARMRRVIDPRNTVFSAKRIIGQSFRSQGVQSALRNLPYEVFEGDNQEPMVKTRAGAFSVVQISTMVLAYLRNLATKQLGKPVTHCVITVPANFSEGQREATRRAAAGAGMQVLRILNEPTAAALAYGQKRQLHQRIAVFDFGGGTFDMTVLAVREDLYEVVATGGDPFLGGDDMDHAVAEHLARQFLQEHRVDLNADPSAKACLLIAAEQIKMKLSKENSVRGTLKELAYGEGGKPLALTFDIDRGMFNMLIAPIVDRSLDLVRYVLEDAEIRPEHIDEIILVGGSTRVPLVRERVNQFFGSKPRGDINPMEVVAAGAALQAHALFAPPDESMASIGLLMDVTSHSLSIATAGGYVEQLIPKNTTIPAEKTRMFTPARDFQEAVKLKVCQGEEKTYDANTPVGELVLDGLPKVRRGDMKLEVSFLIDADGLLQISAKDVATGQTARATLSVVGVGAAEVEVEAERA